MDALSKIGILVINLVPGLSILLTDGPTLILHFGAMDFHFVLIMRRCTVLESIGSSFVDIILKVLVHQKAGTVMAFQPDFLHGTILISMQLIRALLSVFLGTFTRHGRRQRKLMEVPQLLQLQEQI